MAHFHIPLSVIYIQVSSSKIEKQENICLELLSRNMLLLYDKLERSINNLILFIF